LGQIHICGAFSHAPNTVRRELFSPLTLVQPLPFPPLPPTYNVGQVYMLFLQSFNIALGGRGGKGKATQFETENSAFVKLCFKDAEN